MQVPAEPHADRPGPGRAVIATWVVVLCIIWGSTWIIIREGLDDLPPYTAAAVRFAVAWVVMLLVAPALARREGGSRPPLMMVLMMGLLNFGASYAIVYWCETILPSGLVSVLWAVFPMMMALSGHFALGERLVGRQGLGFVVGFVGVGLLFATDIRAVGPEAVPAGLLLLLSPLVSCIGTTYVKRHGKGTSSVLLNRDGMFVGALVLALFALGERGQEMVWSKTAVASVLYLATVGTVLTFGVYYWLMRYASASALSLIAYVTPLIALTLGALLRAEPLSANTVAGTAAILAGVALVLLGKPRRPTLTETP